MFTSGSRLRARAAARPFRRRVRLGVESLETRLTPSTTTTLAVSPNPVLEGGHVTASALVVDGLGTPVGVGQVTFTIQGHSGSVRLEGVSSATKGITLASGNGAVGLQTITAAYSQGGPALPDSSASQQINVIQLTSAQASLTTASYTVGQTITFQGTVGPVFMGDPTPERGSIGFFVDGQSVGTAAVNGDGRASLNIATVPSGPHQLTVQYLGVTSPTPLVSAAASAVSAPVNFTVNQPFGTLAVSPSANPATLGQPVTFTATFTPPAGGPAPTGTVRFAIDSTVATVPLNGTTATYTTSGLTLGDHQVSAIYTGDLTYVPEAASTFTEHVLAPATVTLAVSPSPALVGQVYTVTDSVSGTATVGGQTVTPTGTATFMSDGRPLGTFDVAAHPTVLVGFRDDTATSHHFQLIYSGDGVFQSSASADFLMNIVDPTPTSTTLVVSPAAPVFGQPETVTATVTKSVAGGVPPAGQVDLFVDGPTTGTPAQSLTLNGGSASFSLALPAGRHVVDAVYRGLAVDAGSDSGPVTLTVGQASTFTTLATSLNPAPFGQAVTFTAAVGTTAVGVAPPAGSVTFAIDGVSQGAVPLVNGQAVFTASALPAGPHTVTATYNGSGNFAGSMASLDQTVTPSSPPAPPTVAAALLQDVSTQVRVTRVKRRQGNPQRQTFLVQNIGGTAIDGPVYLVLDGLTQGVKLGNASGLSRTHVKPGDPFVVVTSGQLAAGQGVTVNLLFAATGKKRKMPAVMFTPFVLAGPGVV
jgi:hypothetical protein